MSVTCYNPLTGVDDVIAKQLGISENYSAILRGMGEDSGVLNKEMFESLDTDEKKQAAIKAVRDYRNKISQKNVSRLNEAASNYPKAFSTLSEAFEVEELYNRVNMVSTLFSNILNTTASNNPLYSRDEVLKGVKSGNTFMFGEFVIFNQVYETLCSLASEKRAKGDVKGCESLQKCIDNWPALATMSRIKLRDTEGVSLGMKYNYASEATPLHYSFNSIEHMYDPENAGKDAWITTNGMQSAFGTTTREVKAFLGQIPIIKKRLRDKKTGEIKTIYKRDDLGFIKFLDPVAAYQRLQRLIGTATTESQMMSALTKDNGTKAKQAWLIPIVEKLNSDAEMKTKLFVNLKRNFQFYSILSETVENGRTVTKTKILNRKRDYLRGEFFNNISFGYRLSQNPDAPSVYTSDGSLTRTEVTDKNGKTVTVTVLEEVLKRISEEFTTEVEKHNAVKSLLGKNRRNKINELLDSANDKEREKYLVSNYSKKKLTERRKFLTDTLIALGIIADKDVIDTILYSSTDERMSIEEIKVMKYLKNMARYTKGINTNASYKSLMTRLNKNNNQEPTPLYDGIRKIHELISEFAKGISVENRVLFRKENGDYIVMYSNVNPSYLGDFIDKIKSFVNLNDGNGLKKFLEQEYLECPIFQRVSVDSEGKVKDKKVLNWWLKEMIDACNNSKKVPLSESIVGKLEYMRMLGSNSKEFENFSDKQHMLDMMTNFRSDKDINSAASTALFPIFIQGDANVQKYIRATRYELVKNQDGRYTSSTLLNGFYDTYLSEVERNNMKRELNKQLAEKGKNEKGKEYEKVDNFSDSKDYFSTLVFLNEGFVGFDGKPTTRYRDLLRTNEMDKVTEDNLKAAVQAYMEDYVEHLKEKLNEMKMFEKNAYGQFEHFQNLSVTDMDKFIAEFAWNVKFAMGQQFQLFTIDNSFYSSTKDLQKRFKEIHAPGTILSTEAWDKYNNKRYSEDGIETVKYFTDIKTNTEKTNNGFMQSVLLTYFDKEKVDFNTVKSEIDNGICMPKDNIEAEKKRIERLKELLGDNYSIYRNYKEKNSLTDGQGYRTLRSYRKVMGMAGRWTQEMEAAYKKIEKIRSDYYNSETGEQKEIPSERIAEIARLAAVFQPIKPYLFTHERVALNDSQVALIPVQHKYAEVVLIPELLPQGSKLKDLAYIMDGNKEVNKSTGELTEAPIDLVIATSVVKVGNFGSVDISNVSDFKSLSDALQAGYLHRLNYSDYRIQTNVPEHLNTSRLFGTQIRKLILSGIKKGEAKYGTYFEGIIGAEGSITLPDGSKVNLNDVNGRHIIQLYNSLIISNMWDSMDTFLNNTKDTKTLLPQIIQNLLNGNDATMNMLKSLDVVNDDGTIRIPFSDPELEYTVAAALFSIFKKLVNKQTIKGGSAVQASAMGYTGYKEEDSFKFIKDENGNIIEAECGMAFDISYKDEDGNTVQLDYDEYVDAKTHKLKMGKDGKTSLLEERFPGATEVIAYRIPTERDYSMLRLRVTRFYPKTSGATIMVPAQITTVMGADFDIDKLYLMYKEFGSRLSRIPSTDEYEIFKRIYETRPEIEAALQKAKQRAIDRGEAGAEKKPLNSFWKGMFEEYLSWENDNSYNKNLLFKKAAKELSKDVTESFDRYEYDFSKPPQKNSVEARNNLLLHIMKQRLSDPETLKERVTPGGFTHPSESARAMRELMFRDTESLKGKSFAEIKEESKDINNHDPEPNYDPTDPLTMVYYNQQNQIAGKLIGIFANHNTNHAFASLLDVFELAESIEFCGHSYGDLINNRDGRDAALTIAEFLAASVDAVKDPVLNYLNFNIHTADSAALLARLGFSTDEIGLLFNQPIIKEICKRASTEGLGIDIVIPNLEEEFAKNNNSIARRRGNKKINFKDISEDRLVQGIIDGREGGSIFTEDQFEILQLFKSIAEKARKLSNFVSSTKLTAANSVGSTFGAFYAQEMKLNNFNEAFSGDNPAFIIRGENVNTQLSPINFDESLLSLDRDSYIREVSQNPFGYEQMMYDAIRKLIKRTSKFFPYETALFRNIRRYTQSLTRYNTLDEKTINSLHRDVRVYLLSTIEDSIFDRLAESSEENKNEDYYINTVPSKLYSLKKENSELSLFKYLYTEYNEEGDLNMTVVGMGNQETYLKDKITRGWLELMDKDKKLAEDLFMHCFMKAGFDFSYDTFMSLAPVEIKESIKVPTDENPNGTYVDFERSLVKRTSVLDNNGRDFMIQYFMNHTNNTRFGLRAFYGGIGKYMSSIVFVDTYLGKSANNVITVDTRRAEKEQQVNGSRFFISMTEKEHCFVPMIVVQGRNAKDVYYYIADSFESTESPTMTYRRYKPNSNKFGKIAYYRNAGEMRFENSDNNSLTPESPTTPQTPDNAQTPKGTTPIGPTTGKGESIIPEGINNDSDAENFSNSPTLVDEISPLEYEENFYNDLIMEEFNSSLSSEISNFNFIYESEKKYLDTMRNYKANGPEYIKRAEKTIAELNGITDVGTMEQIKRQEEFIAELKDVDKINAEIKRVERVLDVLDSNSNYAESIIREYYNVISDGRKPSPDLAYKVKQVYQGFINADRGRGGTGYKSITTDREYFQKIKPSTEINYSITNVDKVLIDISRIGYSVNDYTDYIKRQGRSSEGLENMNNLRNLLESLKYTVSHHKSFMKDTKSVDKLVKVINETLGEAIKFKEGTSEVIVKEVLKFDSEGNRIC